MPAKAKIPSRTPSQPKAAPLRRRESLADLAELVLGIAREINFCAGMDKDVVHLTATEINVVRYIDRHPGCMPKDCAGDLGLQRSNFSVLLRSLRDKGMVILVPDESDGRSMRIHPTEIAARSLACHREGWAAYLAGALEDHLDIQECLDVLARIDGALAGARKKSARRGRRAT